MANKISQRQESLLLKEAYFASSSLGNGLTLLRKSDLSKKGKFYLAFHLLGMGLERLMKLIIIERHRGINCEFPDNRTLKDYGHKLIDIFNEVCKFYDDSIIKVMDNHISLKILSFLNDFALSSRYYNLDELTNRSTNNRDPLIEWLSVQNEIRKVHKKRLTQKDIMASALASAMDDMAFCRVFNEKDEEIRSYNELFTHTYDVDYVQGFAVYYVINIISYLVKVLEELEKEYNLYPYLTEFFNYFHSDWLTLSQLRAKRNWLQ